MMWRTRELRQAISLLRVGLVMGVLLAAVIYAGSARAQASCAQGSSVYVVAHADDSILFQNPTLEQDIGSGRCVETIVVTAGDDGQGSSYWMGREAGVKAAYAQIAGVPNAWTQADAGIAGHPMPRFTLTGEPTVSLVFIRIPDGNLDGSGFASTGFKSLQKLWQGTIPTIAAIDGSSSYTTGDLINTLSSLIQSAGADQLVTQDFMGTYGDGDHSDHHTTAYLTEAAGQADPTPHTLTGYLDYTISSLPANLSASDTQDKQATWFSYAPFDPLSCQTVSACQASGYAPYWSREYVSATVQQPSGSSPPALSGLTPTSGPVGTAATISATGFTASHALTLTVGGVAAQITSGGTTNSSGAATVNFTIPALAAGTRAVVVSDGTNSASSPTGFTTLAGGAGGGVIVGPSRVVAGAVSAPLHLLIRTPLSRSMVVMVVRSSSRNGLLAGRPRGPWVRTLTVNIAPGAMSSAPFYWRETRAGIVTITATTGAIVIRRTASIVAAAPTRLIIRPSRLRLVVRRFSVLRAVVLDRFGNATPVTGKWTVSRVGEVRLSAVHARMCTAHALTIGVVSVTVAWRSFRGRAVIAVVRR